MACNNSFDCSLDGIARTCFEDERSCDCSPYFGWTGEFCDEGSPTLAFGRFCLFLAGSGAALAMAFAFNVLRFYLKNRVKRRNRVNPIVYVLGLIVVAESLNLVQFFIRANTFFDPSAFKVQDQESFSGESNIIVVGKTSQAANIVLSFASLFQAFAALFIVLSWLDVLHHVSKFFPDKEFISVEHTKRILAVIFVFFNVLTISIVSLNMVTEATFVYGGFLLPLLLGYIVGLCRFSKMLRDFRDSLPGEVLRDLTLIQRTARRNLLCIAGMLTMAGIFGVLLLNIERLVFNFALIPLYTAWILTELMNVNNTIYCLHIARNPHSRGRNYSHV